MTQHDSSDEVDVTGHCDCGAITPRVQNPTGQLLRPAKVNRADECVLDLQMLPTAWSAVG